MTLSFFNSHHDEFQLRLRGKSIPDPHSLVLWEKLCSAYHDDDKLILHRYFKISSSLPYQHDGLSASLYFPHVLRVASYAGLFLGSTNLIAPVIGLFHNFYEVTNVSGQNTHQLFPHSVDKCIRLLTIDRTSQSNPSYLSSYYHALLHSSEEVRLVKVFDKIDNLYLLHLHDNYEEKSAYRTEVSKYVIPLASSLSSSLRYHLIDLLDFSISHELN